MGDKKYYAARKGISKPEPMDIQLLRNVADGQRNSYAPGERDIKR